MIHLQDPQTQEAFQVIGWTPAIQAKQKALTPWEAMAFEAGAHEAATSPLNTKAEPTQGQKEAGRYIKGRVAFQGLKVAIENPRGSVRSGKGWSVTMPHHYGYMERTTGADGEGVDCFIGRDLDSPLVFIVNQVNQAGAFDEHKVMLGFASKEAARQAYLASYTPGWTGLGSIKTCSMDDLKAWLADGDLRRPVKKANPEGGDGVRWITVHPNGKDEPGHPVQIRPVSGHPGVFHVVGGADGKLNGLRLQGIKDPATYREESKARAKKVKADRERKQEEALSKLTPEEKAQRQDTQGQTEERVKKAKDSLIRATLEAEGLDPEQAMNLPGVDPEEDKLAYSKHRQDLLSHALRTARDVERRVTLDADARTRAGLDTVGGDNHPTADEVLTIPEDEKGPGYQRNLREKAKEAGLTPQALAEAVEDLKVKQAEARVADGDFTDKHVELGGGDPVKGILAAGAIMGDLNRQAHLKAKGLKEASNQAVKESLKQAVLDNEKSAAVLKARKELREAQKALRKGKATLFEAGYQAPIQDLDEAVLQDAMNELRTQRMVGFLGEVEEAHGEDDLDLGKPHVEDGLHASRGAGAFDAVHEIALASMGQGAMDRETAEVLGPDGAGVVLARALRKAYTPEEQAEVLKALEEVHQEEQDHELPKVMEEVNRLRADAMATEHELAQTPRDLATAAEMQRNRVAMLKEARHQLGGFLGRMEARAATIMALKEAPKDLMNVPMGSLGKEQAVLTAAALGLKTGDYDLNYEKGEGVLTLTGQGQDRLIRPFDQAAATERDLAVSLKRGAFDEEGWLPNGFARRPELTTDDPIQTPPMFRKAFDPRGADNVDDLATEVEDYIGARFADGDRTTDILMSLNNLEALDKVPEHLREDFQQIVRNVIPLREDVTGEDGQAITDEGGLKRTRAVTQEQMDTGALASSMAYFQRQGLPEDGAFWGQRADWNSPHFGEAIHQALAKDPRLATAWTHQSDLSTDDQRHIRDYFYESLLGQSAKAIERSQGSIEAAQRAAGPEPEKTDLDMFGEVSTSPAWLEWHDRVQAAMGKAGDDEKEPASPWAQFVETMGGVKNAQKAVQEHMAGKFLEHFADHYERATGKAFKRGQSEIHQAPLFLKATGTPEEQAQAAADRQSETEALRRRSGGKYADMGGEGAIAYKREENRQRGGAAQAEAGSMFDLDAFSEDPPAEEGLPVPEKEAFRIKSGHRLSLGTALEGQLTMAMPNAAKAMQGQERGVTLRPVSMSGRYKAQQRGVKAITNLKRVGLFYGAGSGKTPIMLGAHAELAKSGKVKKAIYSVPSAVQGQFGAEAATFLDPKSGLYIHANPGETFQERLKAYQDPEIHGVVVTHQALRDDTLKVLGQARGIEDHDALVAWVKQAPREELAQAVKDAWTKSGVDYQALFLDEGHNALNRAGKEDSTLAKIVDAIGDTAPYYAAATADPIKNDPSEAYDWLTKMDAKRYPAKGRDEWMARYGKNTSLMRRSMKAELARYYFTARVDPGVEAHHDVISAPVTPEQKAALAAVDRALAGIRYAKTPEELAAHAAVLGPGSDPAMVRKAVGTFKESAYNRILNMDPKGGKVQTTVARAKAHVAAGRPTIVFARNLAAVEAIRQAMEEAGVRVATLTGEDTSAQKAEKKAAFQGPNPKADVLIMSDAGATGLNLQRGQAVIHHDIPLTHMIHSQRTARAWRLGQTHDVQVETIAADHAFDHQNLRRLKRKESLAGIYKSAEGGLDDTGTAERLRAIRERKNQAHEPFAA